MTAKKNAMEKVKVSQCPLCKSDPSFHADFETCESEGEIVVYLICRKCGLVFQSPRLSQAALDAFYRASYRQMIQGSEEPIEKDLRVQYGRASHLLKFVDGTIPKLGRCLDIGSSAGIVLKHFRDAYGCRVQGVEPGDAYREYSQRNGVEAVRTLGDLDPANHGSFDLVILAHTLEHLADPVSYMKDLKEHWISADGYLLVEVPNLYGHETFELAHLTAFAPETLKRALRMAGYKIVRIRTHGRPRSLLIPLYLTALAMARNDQDKKYSMHSSSKLVRSKRKLGMFWNRVTTRYAARWAWLPWPDMQ
jgi:2-polyprenyl-3-methyl-5-hydroxy-6-metoxy-1,4-benzoquinol methylase